LGIHFPNWDRKPSKYLISQSLSNKRLRGIKMYKKVDRLPVVKYRTGLSRSTIYLYMSKGIFPASISLGVRAIGWLESDIDQLLEQRIAASKAAK